MLFNLSKAAVLAFFLAHQTVAQTPISPALYQKIVRYTVFSAAAYAPICSAPAYGSSVVQYFNDTSGTETRATLFRDDSAKELILAFKGTSSPKDLDVDLDALLVPLTAPGTSCSSCLVHEGFQAGYNSLASVISSSVKSQLASHSGYKLIATGHSLGGALAAIAASSLIGQGVPISAMYTFGEPRNGDAAWASYINNQIPIANYYRVTHTNDGVPQIPPTVLNYVHHGAEYWESKDSGNSASTTFKCDTDSPKCNAGQETGTNPINGAHISYSDMVIGSSLFIAGCGAVFP
ncbi:ferulic acid esterase A faeA [Rhexocercosporidium sp. MPI-PUGE-AT-0058]|nr:ferulic acid esterase A faeA [Rhexocercosporidium sp. MPI-PUGE-AT-0058]